MAKKYDLSSAMGGMRKRVGRSMLYTVCDGSIWDEQHGDWNDFTDTLLGGWDPERATRHFRRTYRDNTIQIVHCTVYKQYVDMPLMDFWLEARATSDPVQVKESFIKEVKE